MRRLCAAVLIAALLLMTGCWSRRELTDVSFAGSMGLDWVDDQYQVTVNILSSRRQGGKEGGAPQQNVWTYTERAPSIDAALAKLDQILERSLALAHIRDVFIGEELAKRGMGPVMDFLLRSVEIRPTAWIGITNGTAAELLKARPRQEAVPSDGPMGNQDVALKRSSISPAWRKTHVAGLLQEEGIDLSLPLFRRGDKDAPNPELAMDEGALHGSPSHRQETIYGGAGVFVDDRLVAWLTPEEARGMLWGQNRVVHGAISAECPRPAPNQRMVFRLRRSHGETKLRVVAGKLKAVVRVQVVADVNENTCEQQTLDDGDVSLLQASLADRVRDNVEKAIAVSHETGSDFFGFGQSLFRVHPAEFTARQGRWREIVKELPVQVEVKALVVRTGQMYNRFQWKQTKH